ncbi:BTAD domain-containing putative transcriptional regulator [Streptomyces sp. NPDC058953]|uniref:AfsR/SARP family transcriptional regulator n=1 Tax=unclassified Streptomyces TaxID=2593676 RepID=UPI003681F0A2
MDFPERPTGGPLTPPHSSTAGETLEGFRFGVLGPLHIGARSSTATMTVAPKVRTVLAMLLIDADHVVPASALMRELWPDGAPVSGLRTLQTYVLNCRKSLARFAGLPASGIARDVLETRAGGYCFHSGGAELDWVEYQRLVNLGGRAINRGSEFDGIRLLDQALGLWRGTAFADVTAGPVVESKRRLLTESRLGVIETLTETRIRAGRHQEVIADLAGLTNEHALHEGLHAQYMRALALGGRRARALEVFSDLRTRLVTEIGIEPGLPLQKLQLAILNSHSEAVPPG